MIRKIKKSTRDPKLVELQQKGLQEKNVYHELPPKERTRRIHIGWLFETKGKPALIALCKRLDSTADSLPGWQDLACELNLDSEIIGCIKNRRFLGETETYYTLLTAAQDNELTFDQLLEALIKIGRLDALQQSKEPINSLIESIFENASIEDSPASKDIIKPPRILIPPALVLQSGDPQCLPETGLLSDHLALYQHVVQLVLPAAIQQKTVSPIEQPRHTCILVNNAAPPIQDQPPYIERTVTKIHYDCTVMLTFARDGEKFVQYIAESLRKKRENGMRIGVVILDEHSTIVEQNPEEFIINAFHQVDYMMPVITEGYLQSILETAPQFYPNIDDALDTKWTKSIYTLMNIDYTSRGCRNTKIRCLVPDDMLHLTQRDWRMRQPIFETWYRVNEVEKVGNILLNRKRRWKGYESKN